MNSTSFLSFSQYASLRSLSMCHYSLPSLPSPSSSPSSPTDEITKFQRQFVARLGTLDRGVSTSHNLLPASNSHHLLPTSAYHPPPPHHLPSFYHPSPHLPSSYDPPPPHHLLSSSSSTDSGAFSRTSTPEPQMCLQKQVKHLIILFKSESWPPPSCS